MDYTTRLGLSKPDPDPVTGDFVDVEDLNENADKIDAVISFTTCTSSTRPISPFAGQAILETDTGRIQIWGGSAWIPIPISGAEFTGNLGIGGAPDPNNLRKLILFSNGTNGSLSQFLLRQTGSATGSRALSMMGGGDAQERFWVDFDGKMQWGPGNAGGDVSLGRSGSGVVNVDGGLTVGGVRPGSITEQVITASGTWNKPSGAKQFKVRVVGGGGGGGGAAATTVSNTSAAGGGGGGGGYAEKLFNASDLGSTVAVTIGAGGGGGAAGNNNGTGGGTTSFSTVSATGGGGGTGNPSAATTSYAAGGVSGSGSGGDLNIEGGDGTNGGRANGFVTQQGNGGGTVLGGLSRANGTAAGGNGKAGYSYGGGGAGGHDNWNGSGTARSGGSGAAGVCIVTAYF